MRTLLLHRRGVLFEEQWVGPTLALPPPPSASSLGLIADRLGDLDALATDADALPIRLGLDRELAQFGRIEAIRPWGLHQPTPWERRVVAWIAAQLGVADPLPCEDAWSGPLAPMGAVLADPLSRWPDAPPSGLTLLEGADPDLEALGATRWLRRDLVGIDPAAWSTWTDSVLILVPDDALRLATWKARLEEAGLPVRSRGWQSIADSPVGRWFLSLASLAGGDRIAVRRSDLHAVFDAPLYTMPVGGRRSDLRAILRELRRPSISFAMLRAHAAAWFVRRIEALAGRDDLAQAERKSEREELEARAGSVATVLSWLADALGNDEQPGLWRRLLTLLSAERLSVQRRVGATQRTDLLGALAVATDALDELGRAAVVGETPPVTTLREALASRGRGLRSRPKHGVRLQTWTSWDGQGGHHVVLSGLEEGGFPRPPASLGASDRAVVEQLALGSAADELVRQAQLVAQALGSASNAALLTWSTTDAEGSETFPGAFLAGRPVDVQKHGQGAATWAAITLHVAERDLAPATPGDAWSPADVRTLPRDPGPVDQAWDDAERAALHSQAVERSRAPAEVGVPIGPWAGAIGAPVSERAWSPTALEDLGQCATKFFLARLLRAERDEDLGNLLGPMETGSLVHASFAAAALSAIGRDGIWRLQPTPGEDPGAFGDARADEAAQTTQSEVATLAAEHPTLGVGIARWTAYRWQIAMRAALVHEARQPRGGAFGATVPAVEDLTDAQWRVVVESSDKASAAVERFRTTLAELPRARTLIATLVMETPVTKVAAKARANALGLDTLKTLTLKAIDAATSKAGVDGASLLAIVDEKVASASEKVLPFVEKAFDRDRTSVPRDVLAAEWSFGMPAGDGPLDQRSVEETLDIDVGSEPALALKGRVDRIDGDKATGRLAVVDYKSGTRKSDGSLLKAFCEGRHLQLPIYGRAASHLLAPRALDWTTPAVPEIGRLQFTRSAEQATLDLGGIELLPLREDAGSHAPSPEVVNADHALHAHLAHSARRLRRGILPLVPRACPVRGDAEAWCNFERTCGFSPTAAPLADDDRQPNFGVPEIKGAPTARKLPEVRALAVLARSSEPPLPDEAQAGHAAALATVADLTRDVVVSAGAGSGKTTQLVERYIAALKAGHAPDAILAITFTRKATAEMRTRVRARLLERVEGVSEAALRASLLALGSAPMLTIDAFAARVVQALDVDAPSDLVVAVGSDRFTEGWLDGKLVTACDAPDADLRRLLELLPLSEVRAQLLALLETDAKRIADLAAETADALIERWRAAFERAWPQLQVDLEAFREQATTILDESTAVPAALDEHVQKLRDGTRTALALIEQAGTLGFLAFLPELKVSDRAKLDELPQVEAAWTAIREFKLRWCTKAAPTGVLVAKLNGLVKSDELDEEAKVEALRTALEAEAGTTLAALRVASAWRGEVDAERTRRAVLGFDDVLARATELLRNAANTPAGAAEVRAQLGFTHVFVDEFQDTNRAQVALLEALTNALNVTQPAPRLFLVGDVKQSIYRFRGAEVHVFQAEIERDNRTKTTLDACWRARPPLTRSIDRLFERVLAPTAPDGASTDPLAAVPWQPLAPRWPDSKRAAKDEEVGPCVELLGDPAFEHPSSAPVDDEPLEGAEDDAVDEDIAAEDGAPTDDPDVQLVVDRVKELRGEHPSWTIAILTHSWALAALWGEHLRRAHVPAFVQGGRGLLTDPSVAPIVAVLDALEREDDLGLLEVLRGPLVGVSDTALWAIRNGAGVTLPTFGDGPPRLPGSSVHLRALRHGFAFDAGAARAWLEARAAKQPMPAPVVAALVGDAERIAAWSPWWDAARKSFGLDPLDRTVSAIVESTGYRRVLYGNGGDEARMRLAALRRFERLLRGIATSVEGGGTDTVRELRRMAEGEDDPAAASNPYVGDAVTVTVVHQAKGLAWDVVVLPGLGAAHVRTRVDQLAPVRVLDDAGKPLDLPLVRRVSARDPFTLERGLAAELVHLASEPWERAEQRRLMYVACTRARERVVLAGGLPLAFVEARKALTALCARSPADPPSHRVSRSWLEDVLVALGLRVEETLSEDRKAIVAGTWSLDGGAWVDGVDYRWVQPTATAVLAQTQAAAAWPTDTARRLAAVPMDPVDVRNPSKEKGGAVPAHLAEVAPVGTGPQRVQPFGSARIAGTIAHRAFGTWAWRNVPLEPLAEGAIRDVLPEREVTAATFPARLVGDIEWVVEILRTAEERQPGLARELREAAARGDVVHEARVQVDLGDQRIEGSIDLLWRDADGLWHLLDYKATETDAVSAASIDARIAHYYPQVALYAQTVQGRLHGGGQLATYGLWFVREGRVVRWAVA